MDGPTGAVHCVRHDVPPISQSLWRFDAPSVNRSGVEYGHRADSPKTLSFAHTRATEKRTCVCVWRLRGSGLRLLSLCERVLLESDALRPFWGFRAEPLSACTHSQ